MAVKTSGAELKAFFDDDSFWPSDTYYDGSMFVVDGAKYEDDLCKIDDFANVVIDGVVVIERKDRRINLARFFNKWKERQTTETVVVEVQKSRVTELLDAVRLAGAKRIK